MKLWLDDLRPAPEGWLHAHSVNEAIEFMKNRLIRVASLDHDLGDYYDDGGDAIKFVLWMIENECWPTERILIHTANPVGRENMRSLIERYGPYGSH